MQEDILLGADEVEQETAWAMDFSAMAIVEEEEDLLPTKANELDYVKVIICNESQMTNHTLLIQ